MDTHLTVEVRGGVLWVRLPLVIDPGSMPSAPEVFEELFAECGAAGCSGVVFDARDSGIRVLQMDRLRGVYALAKARNPGCPVAILARHADLGPRGRVERAARQAGAMVRMFADEEKGLTWLSQMRLARLMAQVGGGAGRKSRQDAHSTP